MKTETEKLKEERDRQYIRERHEEVQEYLEATLLELDTLFDHSSRWMRYELGAIVALFVASFGPNIVWILAFILWFGLFLYRHFLITERLYKKMGEMDGAFEVLIRLGFIDRDHPDLRKRAKVKRKSLFKKFKEFFQRKEEEKQAYGTS